jgi:predicted GIY-YIG superfamily endonuclease
MPRQPINHENTHFYKICCNDLNVKDIYVGHTTDFRKRKTQHKDRCLHEKSENIIYMFIDSSEIMETWIIGT